MKPGGFCVEDGMCGSVYVRVIALDAESRLSVV
jgi:hypothetical protein